MADEVGGGKSIRDWVKTISAEYSTGQKVIFVITLTAIIGGFFFLLRWATQPDYVALFSDMDLKDGDQIVEILKSNNVPYRLSDGGKAILVPSGRVHEMRMKLASEGLPQSGRIGYEIFDKKEIGVSEFVQTVNYQRALEGELARTIQALNEIQYARVHLVFPKDRLFKEDQEDATASVLLGLRANAQLSEAKVSGIAYLVANSVEGLKKENVTIIDQNSEILSKAWGQGPAFGLSDSQLGLQDKVEQHLQTKAQSMLDGVLGKGKSIVRVAAELDFQQINRTDEIVDPDQVAVLSEEITEESGTDTAGNDVNTENTITNNVVSKSVQHIVDSVGDIKKLSVAVLADGTYRETTDPAGVVTREYVPRSSDEMTMLEAVVKSAVGFNEERGDQFEIQNIQFDTSHLNDVDSWVQTMASKEKRDFYISIGQKVAVGILLLLLLLFMRSRLRRVRETLIVPVLGEASPQGELLRGQVPRGTPVEELDIPGIETGITEKGKARTVLEKQVSNFVKEKPAIAARLLRYWLVEE